MSFPIVYPFATEPNFPPSGNPWGGQPTRLAPVGDVFVPNGKVAAQHLNHVFGKLGDSDAAILATLGTVQWHELYNPLAGGILGAVAYDSTTGRWLLGGSAPSSGVTVLGNGRGVGGQDWAFYTNATSVLNVTSVCRGIQATSPPNKFAYVAGYNSGSTAGFLERWDTSANTTSEIAPPQTSNVTDIRIVSSGVIIVAVGASASAQSVLQYSTDSGGTFTNVATASLPVPGWLLAQQAPSFPNLLAIPKTLGGSGVSPSAGMDVWSSVDGTTWVHTAVSGLLGAGETPQALTWGADSTGAGCWLLWTDAGFLYRSYNGTSWAPVTTNLQGTLAGMVALPGTPLLVAQIQESLPSARLVFSADGGVTWACCDSAQRGDIGYLALAAGINMFMGLSSQTGLTPSHTYGGTPGFLGA